MEINLIQDPSLITTLTLRDDDIRLSLPFVRNQDNSTRSARSLHKGMSEPDTILLDVPGEVQLEISRGDDEKALASAANCSDLESGVPHRSSGGNGRRFKSNAWQRRVLHMLVDAPDRTIRTD